jgi:hypothetical protein
VASGEPVAERLVDDVAERPAGDEALDVVAEQLQAPLSDSVGLPGHVGRDHDVGHRPERVAVRQRLGIGDIEAGPRQLARSQGGHERLRVHDGAP